MIKTKSKGFSLIETIIFIVIISIVATAILITFISTIRSAPINHQQMIATNTATKCLEWFRGQRKINGFASISCASTAVPTFCTAPTNYTIAVSCDNSIQNIKTITVVVGGKGNSTLSLQLANY